jgi:uncharacterized membrane protein YjjP (DUF1212 family)
MNEMRDFRDLAVWILTAFASLAFCGFALRMMPGDWRAVVVAAIAGGVGLFLLLSLVVGVILERLR